MWPRGLLKEYSRVLSMIMRAFDILAIGLAGWLAHLYKFGSFYLSQHYSLALLCAAGLVLVVFPLFRIYESVRARGFWAHMRQLVQALSVVLILLAGFAFLTKTGEHFSRVWFVFWALFAFVLLIFSRCCLLILLRLMRLQGWNERRIVIIGAGELGARLVQTIQLSLWTGFRIIAIFDDASSSPPLSICHIPVNAMPANLSVYIADNEESIDEVWIALPLRAETRVKEILHELRHDTVTTRFVLDIFGMDLLNHSITNFAGFPVLNIRSTPMIGVNRLIKAIEDRLLASLILVGISPLFLLIALLV